MQKYQQCFSPLSLFHVALFSIFLLETDINSVMSSCLSILQHVSNLPSSCAKLALQTDNIFTGRKWYFNTHMTLCYRPVGPCSRDITSNPFIILKWAQMWAELEPTVTWPHQHSLSSTITSNLICSMLTHIDLSITDSHFVFLYSWQGQGLTFRSLIMQSGDSLLEMCVCVFGVCVNK